MIIVAVVSFSIGLYAFMSLPETGFKPDFTSCFLDPENKEGDCDHLKEDD